VGSWTCQFGKHFQGESKTRRNFVRNKRPSVRKCSAVGKRKRRNQKKFGKKKKNRVCTPHVQKNCHVLGKELPSGRVLEEEIVKEGQGGGGSNMSWVMVAGGRSPSGRRTGGGDLDSRREPVSQFVGNLRRRVGSVFSRAHVKRTFTRFRV